MEEFLKRQYPGITFHPTVKVPVQFAENEVTLDIPAVSMSGWIIHIDKSPWKVSISPKCFVISVGGVRGLQPPNMPAAGDCASGHGPPRKGGLA